MNIVSLTIKGLFHFCGYLIGCVSVAKTASQSKKQESKSKAGSSTDQSPRGESDARGSDDGESSSEGLLGKLKRSIFGK